MGSTKSLFDLSLTSVPYLWEPDRLVVAAGQHPDSYEMITR